MRFFSLCLFSASLLTASEYVAKDFNHLPGKIPGLADNLLKMHIKLYEGYVANTNKIQAKLEALSKSGDTKGPEYAGLKRLYSWEFDGMRLHELYFENLKNNQPLPPDSNLYKEIEKNFGSYKAWKEDFTATGLMRGIGWVILYKDPTNGSLHNIWVNEHNLGHLAGGTPLLVMDVWEHAYITEYGLDRAGYIDAFFQNIDFTTVLKRFEKAKSSSIPTEKFSLLGIAKKQPNLI